MTDGSNNGAQASELSDKLKAAVRTQRLAILAAILFAVVAVAVGGFAWRERLRADAHVEAQSHVVAERTRVAALTRERDELVRERDRLQRLLNLLLRRYDLRAIPEPGSEELLELDCTTRPLQND
jgi:hypothetical protein